MFLMPENMKLRYLLLLFVTAVLSSYGVSAQLVGANIYLPGAYLEIGLQNNGSFGAPAPPAGYYPFPAGPLASVYDQGHDGWTVGTPAFRGDYTYPGSPFEGWEVQADGSRAQGFQSYGAGYNPTAGASFTGAGLTTYSATGGSVIGNWAGTFHASTGSALDMKMETKVDTFGSAVVMTVTFHNNTASAVPGVYYMRSCDPDDDEAHGGGIYFSTYNYIKHQNEDATHKVDVQARGSFYPTDSTTLDLCTKDCRAKAFIYTSWYFGNTVDLGDVWSGSASIGSTQYTLNDSLHGDYAIGLVYKIGTIAAGDSAIICYSYVYNKTIGMDSVGAFPDPQLVVDGIPVLPSFPAPAPIYDTFNTCTHPGLTSVPVVINYANVNNWSWATWTWAPSSGLASTTGVINTVNINALPGITTYTITGTDSSSGMTNCLNQVIYLTIIPCFHATADTPCMNETLHLVAHGDSTSATYFWYGPAGFVAFTQSTTRFPLTMADTGMYYCVKTVGGVNDTIHVDVSIRQIPSVTITSNGPICSGAGNTLLLTSTPDSVGETFAWTGPNGFTSILQNPSVTNPSAAYTGLYKVVTTWNGCMDSSAWLMVFVDSTPAVPTVTSNAPICSSHPQKLDTLFLHSGDVSPGSTYSWTGPSGFVSVLQNPIIPQVHVPASGTYVVTASIAYDGITCHNQNSINVVIDSTPYLPVLGSNAPICSGNALLLTATSTDLSGYNWTGPNGFISGLQNPVITPATTFATGVYTVTATIIYPAGVTCTSDTATLIVVVDSTPVVPGVTSNSPNAPGICQGDTLFLYSSDSTATVGYSWVGPNTFASTLQNPYIYPVSPAATGIYTVTAILGMCSSSAVTTVTITPTPILTVSNNGPVCTGVTDTLFLQAASNPGTTFSWTGPYTFVNNTQNPYRTPVIMEYGGIYQAIAYLNGCPSAPVNDTVITVQTPPAPWISWLTYCQTYDVNQMQAFGDSILWYPNSTVGVAGTLVAPVPPSTSDTVMWFFVRQTNQGCISALDSFKVTINPKPVVTVSPSLGVCPHDTALLTAVDTDPIAYYHWAPYKYISDTVGATVIIRPETDLTYTVVATNKYGCTDTAYTNVSVKPSALLKIDVSDSLTLYPGETFQINPMTNCSYFTWFPPAGLSADNISNPVASPQISTKYTVDGITSWGCKATDSISIYIDDGSVLALPNAFSPGNGPNNTFKILMRGNAVLQYFRIFDRWGNKVFETTDISLGWDGNFKGTLQPFGVYVYEIGAVTSDGHTFTKHGNVTLIK